MIFFLLQNFSISNTKNYDILLIKLGYAILKMNVMFIYIHTSDIIRLFVAHMYTEIA